MRELTEKEEADRRDYELYREETGGCSCHINAPCGSCTHLGNPLNQEATIALEEDLQGRIDAKTKQLKDMDPQSVQYGKVWDERVELIRQRDNL